MPSPIKMSPTSCERRLVVEYQLIMSLRLSPNNPRTHSNKQLRQIAASMKEFGCTNPILIDESNMVIAGHGRIQAAELAGLASVPTIRLCGFSEQQKRALRIADNRIAENAGWNLEILAVELQYLVSVDFDATLTGFETAEIDLTIESLGGSGSDPAADALPEIDPEARPTSRTGDCWLLNRHRLLCGDATLSAALARLMAGEQAEMAFNDPPYNVRIGGHVCGLGAIKHREFMMASGEMSDLQFTEFLATTMGLIANHSADGAIHYVCMDWRHSFELLSAARSLSLELKNICVWNKTNAGMGTFYRSKHEFVFVFKHGIAPHINNFELGQFGRYRTNVWDYPGVNSLRPERLSELRIHPTVKPVAMVADAIEDCSKRNGIILDCFAGSGTTIVAAEKTGRRAFAMEIDPIYVDTAIRRWQEYTGGAATHGETGQTFAETAAARANLVEGNSGTGVSADPGVSNVR